MKRHSITPRHDWLEKARSQNFTYALTNGERYWDESVCYSFKRAQITEHIIPAMRDVEAMCSAVMEKVCSEQEYLEKMGFPEWVGDLVEKAGTRKNAAF